MEDSFSVRVNRAFGSLSSSSSSSCSSSSSSSASQSVAPSLWCLTDEEIEKREWTRDFDASSVANDNDIDNNDASFPSNVDQFFFAAKEMSSTDHKNPNPNPCGCGNELQGDLRELDDDAGEGTGGGIRELASSSRSREVLGDEEDELDVKNSIGMDCTLDYEEEEDEYDKVAVGMEKIGDRLYMCDATNYTSYVNSYNELPNTFKEATRDPRANHLAAKLRLKEDAEAARSFNSLHVSDQNLAVKSGSQNNTPEDGNPPKSILKRKEGQMDSKSEKRVRFEPSCKAYDHRAYEGDKNITSEASNVENTLLEELPPLHHDSASVPDYIRHPLKYTHYTFDASSDMNEESNRQAYTDFLNMVKKSKRSDPDEVPADLTKPMIFNPKKKAGDASAGINIETDHTEITMKEPKNSKNLPMSIAAGNIQEDEACEMEVDEQPAEVLKVGNGKRTARKYRSKQNMKSSE